MEQIVFPIPEICEYLTLETQVKVFHTAERDDQGSKVSEFFSRVDDMFNEMRWQKSLRCEFFFSGKIFEFFCMLFKLKVVMYWFFVFIFGER